MYGVQTIGEFLCVFRQWPFSLMVLKYFWILNHNTETHVHTIFSYFFNWRLRRACFYILGSEVYIYLGRDHLVIWRKLMPRLSFKILRMWTAPRTASTPKVLLVNITGKHQHFLVNLPQLLRTPIYVFKELTHWTDAVFYSTIPCISDNNV